MDKRRRADLKQVHRLGVVHARVPLRHHADELLVLLEVVDQPQGILPADGEGKDGVREQHRLAHRQDGQFREIIGPLSFGRHRQRSSEFQRRSILRALPSAVYSILSRLSCCPAGRELQVQTRALPIRWLLNRLERPGP